MLVVFVVGRGEEATTLLKRNGIEVQPGLYLADIPLCEVEATRGSMTTAYYHDRSAPFGIAVAGKEDALSNLANLI